MPPGPSNKYLEAALDYARRGWPVFPIHHPVRKGNRNICSCGKPDCNSAKHPLTLHGLKDATCDQQQIKMWWTKHPQANVGIITGPESGLVVIDVDPRSGGADSLKAISKLGNIPVTPMAYTGGGGEHIYLAHPGNGVKVKSTSQVAGYAGIDIKGDGGYIIAPPSRHISGGKYSWKRHHLQNKLAAMPEWISDLISRPNRAISPSSEIALNNIFSFPLEGVNKSLTFIPEGKRDVTLFELAKTLRKGGMAPNEVAYHVGLFAENCCDPPLSAKVAIEKVRSTFTQERNLSAELKEYIRLTKGVFGLIECYSELSVINPKEKALIRVNLHKLCEAKVIERLENRSGIYRVVETGLQRIELTDDEDENPLDIKWPFGLENLVDMMPKNIAVVAGSKDSGKTGFCLNFIKMNMDRWKIHYFSSEMGRHELKRRLRRFDDLRISEWIFEPYIRASKFCDVIFPNDINIIDYLEISRDFSLVADEIRQIYDKLETGLAIICLQKDPKAEFGRGASFSIEKARLYLTLDRAPFGNILTIKSGKNWHQEGVNPAGITVKYKIVNGAKLLEYE